MEAEAKVELPPGSPVSNLESILAATTLEIPDLSSSSKIQIHNFSTKVSDQLVCIQIINLGGHSIYIWIGGPDGTMADLSLAATTPYNAGGGPTTTKILGAAGDNCSETLGGKLSKRLGKPVYLSLNLMSSQFPGWSEVEKTLMDELNSRPSHFFA